MKTVVFAISSLTMQISNENSNNWIGNFDISLNCTNPQLNMDQQQASIDFEQNKEMKLFEIIPFQIVFEEVEKDEFCKKVLTHKPKIKMFIWGKL